MSDPIGEMIRAIRLSKGLTLREVAESMTAAGRRTALNKVSTMECGKRGVTVPDLRALAVALDVHPAELLGAPEAFAHSEHQRSLLATHAQMVAQIAATLTPPTPAGEGETNHE